MFPSAQTFSVEDTDIQLWRIAPDEGPLNLYSFSFKAGIVLLLTVIKAWIHNSCLQKSLFITLIYLLSMSISESMCYHNLQIHIDRPWQFAASKCFFICSPF